MVRKVYSRAQITRTKWRIKCAQRLESRRSESETKRRRRRRGQRTDGRVGVGMNDAEEADKRIPKKRPSVDDGTLKSKRPKSRGIQSQSNGRRIKK